MAFGQFKLFILICIVIHGVVNFIHDWHARPQKKAARKPSDTAIWAVLIAAWFAVHAAPAAYYGSELFERLFAENA